LTASEKLCDEVGLTNERSSSARPAAQRLRPALHGGTPFAAKHPAVISLARGNASGTRLNRHLERRVKDRNRNRIASRAGAVVKERSAAKRFGDWCDRVFLNETPKANN